MVLFNIAKKMRSIDNFNENFILTDLALKLIEIITTNKKFQSKCICKLCLTHLTVFFFD